MRRVLLQLGFTALLVLGGCAAKENKVSALTPSLDELPNFEENRNRNTSAVVEVEHDERITKIRAVGEYKEPPLTDEEKAAVAAGKEQVFDDDLVFFKPPRGAEHGVYPGFGGITVGVQGRAGPLIQYNRVEERFGRFGLAGRNSGIWPVNIGSASTYGDRPAVGERGPASDLSVGVGLARPRTAAKMKYLDY